MVGFDVAKKSLVVAVLSSDGVIIRQGCTIENTDEALRKWLETELSEVGHDLAICCESTGYFHYSLLRVATALDLPCRVLNPILTKQAMKATVRGKKTDRTDAVLIARLGLRGEGQLQSSADTSGKQLLRTVAKLTELQHTVARVRNSLGERQISLSDCAAEQFDILLQALVKLKASLCDEAVVNMDGKLIERLSSITGIGTLTATTLAAEIGDMQRFTSIDRLVAYSGLDPRVRQSGTSMNRNSKLTKRGSPYLRRIVFMAANVMRLHDVEVGTYYKKKRSEGRTHTEAMMPVCRKFLARVHAVWLREQNYVSTKVAGPETP